MQQPINILILEDRREDAELLVLELENTGLDFVYQCVDTRETYLEHLAPGIDVILADYNLPQFSAPQALTLLQQRGYDIPFIVVTGTISEEAAVDCMKGGAGDYLLKDRLSRLGEAIKHALVQRDLRRTNQMAQRDLWIMSRAIGASINAVVIADPEGHITFVNDAFVAMWGLQDAQHVNGLSLNLLWIHEETGAVNIVAELYRRRNFTGELRTKSETNLSILQYSASLVLDSDQQPLCMMAMFIDITEQKLAEAARREADILRIELEKEKELRELKSRFTSMVIHDFRTPMSAILLTLSMMQKQDSKMDSEKRYEKLQGAIDQMRHMNQLLDDVLMIGKLDTLQTTFDPSEQDFQAFCYGIFLEYEAMNTGMNTRHYQFVYSSNQTSIFYHFDTYLMRRLVSNLLSNAVKYSPSGGKIEMAVQADSSGMTLRVSDQGIGIPEADQRRLFDTFHRASNVGAIEGTGLGLTIIKQVADLHNGKISVLSKINQGTTFVIEFAAKPILSRRPSTATSS